MTFSCSDFTSTIINHLFANGLIKAEVVDADDLEHQATESMAAISNLAERASKSPAPASGKAFETSMLGQTSAAQFMEELLAAHETLTDIGEEHGARTLADSMYLLSAIQKGTFIEVHHPTESEVLEVIRALPSAALWMSYVKEVSA